MDQNQAAKSRTLKRLQVGGLPLIHAIIKRMRLKEILWLYSEFPTAEYAKYQAGYAFYPDFK